MEGSNLRGLMDEEIVMKTGKVAGIGLAAGSVWGALVSTLKDGPQVGSNVKYPELIRTAKVCRHYAASFAVIGATYVGVDQALEKFRMKKDIFNGAAAGFATGAVMGYRAVRIRQGCKLAGVSLSPRRRRRTSCAAAAAVRAEVSFVDADEAKRLVAEEGYTVLDIRDRTQRERAYIKSSTHLHNNFAGLFFGLPFTKLNPDFAKAVKDKFSPESKLLVVCQEGLRSAAAADALEREGFQNIACITSGLQTVKPGAYLFITLFPDQAEKLFDLAGISL
nr:unnamed protein product [Digitaria exilis]